MRVVIVLLYISRRTLNECIANFNYRVYISSLLTMHSGNFRIKFQTYSDGSWRRGLFSFMLTVSLRATPKDSCGKNLIEKKQ